MLLLNSYNCFSRSENKNFTKSINNKPQYSLYIIDDKVPKVIQKNYLQVKFSSNSENPNRILIEINKRAIKNQKVLIMQFFLNENH